MSDYCCLRGSVCFFFLPSLFHFPTKKKKLCCSVCVRCCWRPVIINALKIVLMTGSCVNVVVFLPRPVYNIRKSCRLFRLDCEQRRKLNLFVCCCWFFLINSFGGNEPTMAIGAAASLHFIIRQRGPATNG